MSDGAGEIAALGSGVGGWAVGDRAMGAFFPDWTGGAPTDANTEAISGETIDGFAAEFAVVPAHSLCRMPAGWSFAEAATLPCAGLTAWRALRVEGRLVSGATVLLPGSGGLSVYMLQIAKALGIRVIVISSSDDKLARLAALGADHGINYRTDPEWGAEVRALTGGAGADLVLEIGGQSTIEQSVAACRMAGQIMVVGSTSNAAPVLPLRDVVMHHIRIVGMAVGSVAQLGELADFVEQHDLRPVIDRAFPLEQLGEAFQYQLTGGPPRQDRHRHLKGNEMTAQTLVSVVFADGLAHLRLRHPAQGNVLDLPMIAALDAAVGQVESADVRAILISAEGRNFCVGGDLARHGGGGGSRRLAAANGGRPAREPAPDRGSGRAGCHRRQRLGGGRRAEPCGLWRHRHRRAG